MTRSPIHGLPLLAAGQAQKEVTHNEALLAIDRRLQIVVATRNRLEPPDAPVAGMRFIVPADATGSWAGRSERIACFDGFGWTFDAPQPGWLAWIADEAAFSVYDGAWTDAALSSRSLRGEGDNVVPADPVPIAGPSGGVVVDIESRQSIDRILSVLRAHALIA